MLVFEHTPVVGTESIAMLALRETYIIIQFNYVNLIFFIKKISTLDIGRQEIIHWPLLSCLQG